MTEKFNLNDPNNLPSGYTLMDVSEFAERWQKNEQLRKEREAEAKKIEKERVNNISCPVCHHKSKDHHIKYKSNGIIGPGHKSVIVESYLICLNCGVHYSDVEQLKKKKK
jgi:hypothetical protein